MTQPVIFKKHIRLSYCFSWTGLGLMAVGIILQWGIQPKFMMESTGFFSVVLAIGIIFLFVGGGYFLCCKCKCPVCGFGSGGKFDDGFHKVLSLKKQSITCPRCKSEIKLM